MENNQFENKEKLTADKIGSLTKQLEKNWQIIAKANNTWDFRSLEKARSSVASLKDLRAYDKLNLDPNGTYVEAVQIGQPFSIAPVTKIVRKQA